MTRHRTTIGSLVITCGLLAGTARLGAQSAWQSIGPRGGTVTSVAICSLDRLTVYAGTASAGVFRSEDGGEHWVSIAAGLPRSWVTALTVAPNDCAVVYAATISNFVTGSDPPEFFLSLSLDRGRSWVAAPAGPRDGSYVYSFASDPRDHSTLYAAASSGLFRTRAGATRWSAVWRPNGLLVSSAAVATDGTLYATVFNESAPGQSVYKSVDDGVTWHAANGSSPSFATAGGAFNLLFDPSDSHTLYVIPGILFGPVFKSTDGAQTWTRIHGVGERVQSLTADSLGVLFASVGSPAGVLTSLDHGMTWRASSRPPFDPLFQLLALNEGSGDRLIGAGEHGAWLSTDGGATWRPSDLGLLAEDVQTLAVATDGTIYLGTASSYCSPCGDGVLSSTDGGTHWRRLSSTAGTSLTVDPVHPNTLYTNRLYQCRNWARSDDRGLSWTCVNVPLDGLLVDPTRSATLYSFREADGYNDEACLVQRSLDRGATWSCIQPALQQGFSLLLVDPQHPTTLLGAGQAQPDIGYEEPYVLRSLDGGRTWHRADHGLPQAWSALAIDPTADSTLYAVTPLGFYRSTNEGESWTLLSTRPAAGVTLKVDPLASGHLFVGVPHEGILASHDGGATWHARGEGLPILLFTGLFDLTAATDSVVLYAGTSQGVFKLKN